MEFKDYYQVLGVERGAAVADIKKAYRKLVRKHHPDVNKAADAQVRMQELNEAWEVLQDPEKRAAYDQVGQRWQGGSDAKPSPDWNSGFEFSGAPEGWEGGVGGRGGDEADHSAFFESLFGAARRGSAGRARRPADGNFAARGNDHHAKIVVPLEDAFNGATRTLSLQSAELDDQGRPQTHTRQLAVTIPKGLKAGQQIRLAGQGTPGFGGGAAGDLFLELQFEPHPRYRAEGRDLYATLAVAPWEAALGAQLPVATPGGEVEISVPAESQAGRQLRLKGRGIPAADAKGVPGDLYLVLEVVLPPARTDAERAAWRQLAETLAFDPRQGRA